MKTIELYFMRHGQTIFNATSKVQGWSDSFLTEEGENIVRLSAQGLKRNDMKFDYLFSSDSGRTQQTSRIVLEQYDDQNLEITLESKLREFNFGIFEGGDEGELRRQILEEFNIDEETFYNDPQSMVKMTNFIAKVCCQNGESKKYGTIENDDEYRRRLKMAIAAIIQKLEQTNSQRALIVAHGLSINTIARILVPGIKIAKGGIANASITKVSYREGDISHFNRG
ncbi:MAG: histidine phosphatase family protein [Culicoidibacterales bacterium]